MKRILLTLTLVLFVIPFGISQVSINGNTNISGSLTAKNITLPFLSQIEIDILSPEIGDIVYNSTIRKLQIYSYPNAETETISFDDIGTSTSSELSFYFGENKKLKITGSPRDINVLNLNGLGITGGSSGNSVDYGGDASTDSDDESITFEFIDDYYYEDYGVFNIRVFIGLSGQSSPSNGETGERQITVYDISGNLIGDYPMYDPSRTPEKITFIDGEGDNSGKLISKLTLRAISSDYFIVRSITFDHYEDDSTKAEWVDLN
ncbi:MAG: hypothetical protein HOI14_03305 [Flavobacteriaceae bacterium]|jgi:hypothetical protein|nr:hypothetical protein [Flavobacteriaceae bacterium]